MRWNVVPQALCAAYVVFLTSLLLTADPMGMIGAWGEAAELLKRLMPIAHLLSFFVLTVLFWVARWPVPRWILIASLIVYGGITEIVQGFLPPRTPDWMDWFQDVAGVMAGVGFCWGWSALMKWLHSLSPQER